MTNMPPPKAALRSLMRAGELELFLNDTWKAKPEERAQKVGLAVRDVRDFIAPVRSVSPGALDAIRVHFNKKHGSSACSGCPQELLWWFDSLPTLGQSTRWKDAGKDPLAEAVELLRLYLSIAAGLRPATVFRARWQGGQWRLCNGNNRLRLLLAMGMENLEVAVRECDAGDLCEDCKKARRKSEKRARRALQA